jgi:hypothetical protein
LERLSSVVGCGFSVVSCRLWVLVLIGLHTANLGAGCLERFSSVVGFRLSVVGFRLSVVGFRLWVLVLIGLHAANLGAGCLERLFSVVGCGL